MLREGLKGKGEGAVGFGGRDYSQIFSRRVEVKATVLAGKLELFNFKLYLPTRSWESMNPLAGS